MKVPLVADMEAGRKLVRRDSAETLIHVNWRYGRLSRYRPCLSAGITAGKPAVPLSLFLQPLNLGIIKCVLGNQATVSHEEEVGKAALTGKMLW